MSKLAHSNQETMDQIERDARAREHLPDEPPSRLKAEMNRDLERAVEYGKTWGKILGQLFGAR